MAAGLAMAGVAARAGFSLRLLEDQELKSLFFSVELGVPLMMLAGYFLLLDGKLLKLPGVYRLLLATAAVGGLSLLIFPRFFYNDTIVTLIQDQIRQMGLLFRSGNAVQGGFDDALVENYFSDPAVFQVMRDVFFRTYLTGFALVLLFFWRLGERLQAGLTGTGTMVLKDFRVPRQLLWPALIALFLMLLEMLVPMGLFRYPVWNAGVLLLLVYGFQGLGILLFLMDRYRFPRGMRFLVFVILVSLLLRPGVNVVIMIVIPALGISETWIRYRNN